MEQLINFIIRPPRAEYDPKHDLLDEEFMLKGKWYQRKDLEVVNSRGDVLKCSHYMPLILPEEKSLPCVIYCHGNSGCRTDASEAAVILLPLNISVFTLDFSGSGLSGGEHVTLGWNERDDLRAVVDYLRADGNVSLIGLWGRSMGAVTCLMYGTEDPSIAGMVLDSPFSDLVDLMMELVDTYKVRVPKFTIKFVIQYMRRSIQKKANFDIMDLNAAKVAKSCFVPVLFGHATDDDFIQPHHSDRIFEAYIGDKNIIKFEGDHNSPRPQFYFDSISIFFKNVLQPPEDEAGSEYFDLSNDYFNQGRWSILHDSQFSDEFLGAAAVGSTEDAIRQLRSKRPMSSVVVPTDISSKDDQPPSQVGSTVPDSHPSCSDMISFELSKDGPHASMDEEEEYVEYPLDSMSDFPSNVEEEERMIMEAILESLKLSEVPKHEPEPKDKDSVSILETEVPCTLASEHNPPSDAETQEANSSDVSSMNHSIDSSKNPVAGEDSSDPTCNSHEPSCSQSPADLDIVDCTKVTVEVEKKEPANVMDGLLRRLDFNFFRNR